MTHVVLHNAQQTHEIYITFPIVETFPEYLSYVKSLRPNANWKPFQSWET